MSDRMMRYLATAAGGAVGGAAMGGILRASGTTKNTGAALGYGALIGAVAGLATAGAADAVSAIASRAA